MQGRVSSTWFGMKIQMTYIPSLSKTKSMNMVHGHLWNKGLMFAFEDPLYSSTSWYTKVEALQAQDGTPDAKSPEMRHLLEVLKASHQAAYDEFLAESGNISAWTPRKSYIL